MTQAQKDARIADLQKQIVDAKAQNASTSVLSDLNDKLEDAKEVVVA